MGNHLGRRRVETHRLNGKTGPSIDVLVRRQRLPNQLLPLQRLLIRPGRQLTVISVQKRGARRLIPLLQPGELIQQPLGFGAGHGITAHKPRAHRQTVAMGGAADRGEFPQRFGMNQRLLTQRDQGFGRQLRPIQAQIVRGQAFFPAPAGNRYIDEHELLGQQGAGLRVHTHLLRVDRTGRTLPTGSGRMESVRLGLIDQG